MTDKKISALPAASAITGAEVIPIVQNGNTVKSTVSDLFPTEISGNKTALGDWFFKSGRPWKDPGGTGNDATDNNTSTAGLLQTAFNAAQNLPGAGGGKGLIRIERGTFRYTTGISITTGAIHVKGVSRQGTVLKPVGAIIGVDIQTSGAHTFEDLTLDGSLLTTDAARLLRLGNGTSLCSFVRVNFMNMSVAVALELFGSLDNYFDDCVWSLNNRHVLLHDSGVYPSNQNVFNVPKFTDATATTGAAVEIINADGTVIKDGLVQGNNCLKTILIRNTAGGLGTARANKIRNMWMESNGNVQAGSRGISIEGSSTTNRLVGTIIDGNQLLSSVQNDPSTQIYCTNTDGTIIDDCLSNLGSPNISVEKGPGNINLQVGQKNTFGGVVQASGSPAVFVRRTGAGQTIPTGGVATKVTFNTEDIDNNGDFTASTYTPTVAGTYKVTFSAQLENCDDQQRFTFAIYKNGASVLGLSRVTSGTVEQAFDMTVAVNVDGIDDTIEAYVSNHGATSRNIGAGTAFSAHRVA